jgi:hypothetical protein
MPLYNESVSVLALPLANRTASANGNTIDRVRGGNAYENILCIVLAGTITDGTHAVVLQDSDDGTTWTNIAAGQIQGSAVSLQAAQSNTVAELGAGTSRRFIRANTTVTGAPATGGTVAAVFVLADPSYLPAR